MERLGFPVNRDIEVEPTVERQLMTAVCTQSSLLWEGAPGVGKTSTVLAITRKYGIKLEMVLMSMYDYQDVMGWPIQSKQTVKIAGQEYPSILFAPPRWVAHVAQATKEQPALIYLNEINGGTPHQHLMANRVAFERHAGDVNFNPRFVGVVADCNPPELATGGSELSPAMIGRFDYYENGFKPSMDFFIKHYPSYFGTLEVLGYGRFDLDPATYAWARQSVAAFLRAAKNEVKFHHVPASEAARRKPQPGPRAWDFAARKLAFVRQMGWPIEEALPMMISRVGEVAGEAMTWMCDQDLRDPEEIITQEIDAFGGDKEERFWKRQAASPFKLEKRGDKTISLLAALQTAVLANLNRPRYVACWRILHAAAQQNGLDIAIAAAEPFIRKAAEVGLEYPMINAEAAPFAAMLREVGKIKAKARKPVEQMT